MACSPLSRRLGLTGRREPLLEELAEACRAKGAQAELFALDVCDGAGMKAAADDFVKAAGGIDLVIANAGMGNPDRLASGDAAPLTRLMEVNVCGVLNTLLPFIPTMKDQGMGHLVAVASIAGAIGLPKHTAYSASKAAVRMLMDGFAYELNAWGIHTTTINPGFVVSEMTAKNRFRMPFLMDADDAVRGMRKAIRKHKRVYTFPLPTRFATWVLTKLPRFLIARLPT